MVKGIYVLKSKEAVIQISARQPFKIKEMHVQGPEAEIGMSHTRNQNKNNKTRIELVCMLWKIVDGKNR